MKTYARIPCAHCGEPICSNNTRRHASACEKRIAAAKLLADPAFREKFNGPLDVGDIFLAAARALKAGAR